MRLYLLWCRSVIHLHCQLYVPQGKARANLSLHCRYIHSWRQQLMARPPFLCLDLHLPLLGLMLKLRRSCWILTRGVSFALRRRTVSKKLTALRSSSICFSRSCIRRNSFSVSYALVKNGQTERHSGHTSSTLTSSSAIAGEDSRSSAMLPD